MLTILAGLALYLFSSSGLSAAWITSGPGIGFTLGSLAALAACGSASSVSAQEFQM